MRSLPLLDPEHGRPAAEAALHVVRGAGVVLVPTETFYGLAADPTSDVAVDRVHGLKRRPADRALPVLCADHEQVVSLVELPERFRVRIGRIWPGPVTIVLPLRRPLAACPGGTVAVRIPDHRLLRAVLYRTGPLTGTSANRHGEPACTTADAALGALDGRPDLVLDGGPTPGGRASTIVDLTGREPRVLRRGPVAWDPPELRPDLPPEA